MSEEVGHGDEAAADDAGGDFGDAGGAGLAGGWDGMGLGELTSTWRRGIGSRFCRGFGRSRRW